MNLRANCTPGIMLDAEPWGPPGITAICALGVALDAQPWGSSGELRANCTVGVDISAI